MKIDLATFAFGSEVKDKSGTPNWATALGQSSNYKINKDSSIDDLLRGMVYSSIPNHLIQMPIGKGGKVYNGADPKASIVLCSSFKKIYANKNHVPECEIILVINRDTSGSHNGRLRLKYSPKIELLDEDGRVVKSNNTELQKIKTTLGMQENACWFVYKIDIINQDELHLSISVVDKNGPVVYASHDERKEKWLGLIGGEDIFEEAGGENGEGGCGIQNPEVEIPKLSLEELGEALSREYEAEAIAKTGNGMGSIYTSILKYGDSIFDENDESLYSAKQIMNAALKVSEKYKRSFETEIAKALKMPKLIRQQSEEHGFLKRLLGVPPQPKPETPAVPADRLTVALRLFKDAVAAGEVASAIDNVYLDDVTSGENALQDEGTPSSALTDEGGTFEAEVKKSPKLFAHYLENPPEGYANQLTELTKVLVSIRPADYTACTEEVLRALKFLELTKVKALPEPLTAEVYESLKAVQTQIRDKMHEMEILSCSGEKADYLTVAEFLKWVVENKEKIEEKAMKANWKNIEQDLEKDEEKRSDLKLELTNTDDRLLYRLMVALRTKPFAILAGHSGTGKSRLVRRLARLTCNDKILRAEVDKKSATGNYLMVQVKPNWHDSTDLLGYYSDFEGRHYVTAPFVEFICKAYAYPETPFFLCLDEMNLAPVEQYFAEYLSAIESMEKRGEDWVSDSLIELDKHQNGDEEVVDYKILADVMKNAASENAAKWIQAHGLTIPKNLFVVGTVNMDDTTCQFSRKVLDRAMTIEMSDVDFSTFGKTSTLDDNKAWKEDVIKALLNRKLSLEEFDNEDEKTLDASVKSLQECLAQTHFAIAYRFAKEYVLYRDALNEFKKMVVAPKTDETQPNGAETGVLPSGDVEGSAKTESSKTVRPITAIDQMVLMKVLPRIQGEKQAVEKIFNGGTARKSLRSIVTENSESSKKMDEILKRGGENANAYLTFWP